MTTIGARSAAISAARAATIGEETAAISATTVATIDERSGAISAATTAARAHHPRASPNRRPNLHRPSHGRHRAMPPSRARKATARVGARAATKTARPRLIDPTRRSASSAVKVRRPDAGAMRTMATGAAATSAAGVLRANAPSAATMGCPDARRQKPPHGRRHRLRAPSRRTIPPRRANTATASARAARAIAMATELIHSWGQTPAVDKSRSAGVADALGTTLRPIGSGERAAV